MGRDDAVPGPRAPFRPARGLRGLAAFGGLGLGLSGIYAVTGHGLWCPFKLVTGWDCPFCGGTRLGAALLRGHPAAAFAYNPLVFVGLAIVVLLGLAWLLEVAGGPRLRPPARIRSVHPTVWTGCALAAGVAYTVCRHLFFPVPA